VTLNDVLLNFLETNVSLQETQAEFVVRQTALIQTLNELLPGFRERFEALNSVAEKVCAPDARAELEKLRRAIDKLKPN
jgi:hypothetical protein